MEFINRVRAHETIWLSVLSWIRYCSAITRFPVPGAEPGTHVHSHVVSDVILWRVLGRLESSLHGWIESLRDHRTCQIPLEKFMVQSQFTLWSAVLWCPYLLSIEKRFIELRSMFWDVWNVSERNKIHALSQNMGIKKSENHLFKWNEMMYNIWHGTWCIRSPPYVMPAVNIVFVIDT